MNDKQQLAIEKEINNLSMQAKKMIGKQIAELHENAYRRGFQHGSIYILNSDYDEFTDGWAAYEALTKWRFKKRKVSNSPYNYHTQGKIGYLAKINCEDRPLKNILEDCNY